MYMVYGKHRAVDKPHTGVLHMHVGHYKFSWDIPNPHAASVLSAFKSATASATVYGSQVHSLSRAVLAMAFVCVYMLGTKASHETCMLLYC